MVLGRFGTARVTGGWAAGLAATPWLPVLGYWLAGVTGLLGGLALAASLSVAILLRKSVSEAIAPPVPPRIQIERALDAAMDESGVGSDTACVIVCVDDRDALVEAVGQDHAEAALATIGYRLGAELREIDTFTRLAPGHFAIALAAASRYDLETLIQLAGRLHARLSDSVPVGAQHVRLSACIGFVIAERLRGCEGSVLFDAAGTALADAQRVGPGAIRAFSPSLDTGPVAAQAKTQAIRRPQAASLSFQPRLCTDTGRISGVAVVAPDAPPDEVSEARPDRVRSPDGQIERLLAEAFTAMGAWDDAGIDVPEISMTLSAPELRHPALSDRITWQVDRFDMAPHRLCLDIPEDTICGNVDVATLGNIDALVALGCTIGLDDFGSGPSSLPALRRFSIRHVTIPKVFVFGIDRDIEQKRIVSTIIGMCDSLQMRAIAKGVTTPGEHSTLAQLGCGHVIGPGIALPMEFDAATQWMARQPGATEIPPLTNRDPL